LGNKFLRLAVVYFLMGVVMGLVMAAKHDYTLMPVHAHLNLLGWVSMALFGLWYRSAPAAGETRLARVHFWLHNAGLPIQMVTLGLFLMGQTAVEPVLVMASLAVGVGVLCFAVNLWWFTGR
jgi:cbb3-type cytochrome oxidase subunit 1